MTKFIDSIRGEYLRYKALAEKTLDQLSEDELSLSGPNGGNSIATICWHIGGNFQSRFTDFLTSDGEKPWRQREEEFEPRTVTRAELLAKWNQGWQVLLSTLESLTDEQLEGSVTIRGQPLLVHEALHRSLAHLSYHVGQIVYLAKSFRGSEWKYLSIPPGMSDAVNTASTRNGETMADNSSQAAAAPPVITAEQLLKHWQGHRGLTRRFIDAFPDKELFEYSIGGMRTFSQLVLEFIGMAVPTLIGVTTGEWPKSSKTEPPATKAELLRLWDETTAEMNRLWPTIKPDRFQETDKAFGQWEMPVHGLIFYLIDNEIHHRGQASVYLRSLGIEPPAFYER